MHDNGVSLATLVVGLQMIFYVFGWLIFAATVREERTPIVHWIAFLLCLGLGFFNEVLRLNGSAWWRPLLSTCLFLGFYPIVIRGFEVFLRLKPHDREHLITAAGLNVAILIINLAGYSRYNLMFLHFGQGVLILRALSLTHAAVRAQYGALCHAIVIICVLLWAAFSFTWGIGALLHPGFGDLALSKGREAEITLFATLASMALFNALFIAGLFLRLVTQVRNLSERDPLTGLLNRRAFYERVEAMTQRAGRDKARYSALLLDLDHFKEINDRHGHAAGDAVLAATAEVLRREMRAMDIVCRWGGEEFAILLSPCSLEDALNVAERIREAIAAISFEWNGEAVPLTTSIGVSISSTTVEPIDQQLARCDIALYQAKAQGRNRWVVAHYEEMAARAPSNEVVQP